MIISAKRTMWVLYSFKLSYANDNTFTMMVDTWWTLSEFTNKVREFALMKFPQIDPDDTFSITESWNYLRSTQYNTTPSEENTPILTNLNCDDRIYERYGDNSESPLTFYISFDETCRNFRLRRESGDEEPTTEMVDDDSVDSYHFYDIHDREEEERAIQFENYRNQPYQSRDNQSRIIGDEPAINVNAILNTHINNNLIASSSAVELDDMLVDSRNNRESSEGQLRNSLFTNETYYNIIPTYLNETINNNNPDFTIPSNVAEFALDDSDIIPHNLNSLWGRLNNNITIDIFTDDDISPPILNIRSSDCCICFNEHECIVLDGCDHTVCGTCYRGVFQRINHECDLRCPMCRNDNAFTYEIYSSL